MNFERFLASDGSKMTIPEEVQMLFVGAYGWEGWNSFFFFFRNLGNPLGEKFESCGGKLWSLRTFRNASIGNKNSKKHIRFSPHFSKQEGFLGQIFGCFFLDYCIWGFPKMLVPNTHGFSY